MIFSMRNSNIFIISTSEYLSMESEWYLTKLVTDHYIWIFPFFHFL
jgi:hypothetical protein